MICEEKKCYICGIQTDLQVHHCLHGTSRRAKADEHGLTVYLCGRCHTKLHDHGVHDLDLQKVAQAHFEKTHTHDEYMEIFGKNYLD